MEAPEAELSEIFTIAGCASFRSPATSIGSWTAPLLQRQRDRASNK